MTMKQITAAAMTAAVLASTACAQTESAAWPACGTVETWPAASWPEATPRSWDEAALADARARFEASGADSVMVVHRGHPIAAWGPVGDPLTIQSMRKPVLGALIGQLVDQGRLDPDATLAELDINDSDPALTEEERQATVRDLLLARSGIMHDANYEVGGWRRLREEIRTASSTSRRGVWFYNNWDFNALGMIAERAGGQTLGAQLEERLADPIGMEDFDPATVGYSDRSSRAQQHFGYGSDLPAYMFEMSTRDLARFGLLYLACGNWDDDQVVPEAWVRESITGVDTYIDQPDGVVTGFDRYGYLWWVEDGGNRPRFGSLEHAQPFYGGSGNRGHFLLVFPHLDLVIVHQPRTVGGISDEGQIARARNGSPQVRSEDFAALVNAILDAHPDRAGE